MRTAAFGDIDNDGDVDVVVNDLTAPHNRCAMTPGNVNNSILVRTVGGKSNRVASVPAQSSRSLSLRRVRGWQLYISQNDLRLHLPRETNKSDPDPGAGCGVSIPPRNSGNKIVTSKRAKGYRAEGFSAKFKRPRDAQVKSLPKALVLRSLSVTPSLAANLERGKPPFTG